VDCHVGLCTLQHLGQGALDYKAEGAISADDLPGIPPILGRVYVYTTDQLKPRTLYNVPCHRAAYWAEPILDDSDRVLHRLPPGLLTASIGLFSRSGQKRTPAQAAPDSAAGAQQTLDAKLIAIVAHCWQSRNRSDTSGISFHMRLLDHAEDLVERRNGAIIPEEASHEH